MVHVKSTTRLREDVADAGDKGASAERNTSSEGRGNGGSAERTESVQASDVGSHSGAEADTDEGLRTRSCYFGPSTVTVMSRR
jgi:hypothetical protein